MYESESDSYESSFVNDGSITEESWSDSDSWVYFLISNFCPHHHVEYTFFYYSLHSGKKNSCESFKNRIHRRAMRVRSQIW